MTNTTRKFTPRLFSRVGDARVSDGTSRSEFFSVLVTFCPLTAIVACSWECEMGKEAEPGWIWRRREGFTSGMQFRREDKRVVGRIGSGSCLRVKRSGEGGKLLKLKIIYLSILSKSDPHCSFQSKGCI